MAKMESLGWVCSLSEKAFLFSVWLWGNARVGFNTCFGIAVLDLPAAHILISISLAQLLACFSEVFQDCGGCQGGLAEVVGSVC